MGLNIYTAQTLKKAVSEIESDVVLAIYDLRKNCQKESDKKLLWQAMDKIRVIFEENKKKYE